MDGPLIPGLEQIGFGGDYNPDGWPEHVLKEDMELMRRAGVNLVTVGVFSWYAIEPRAGTYDFAWLDATIERLDKAGVGVCLATPTAGPPAWFWRANPDARVLDRQGHTLGTAARGIGCPSSATYRDAAARVASALAERYGEHPAVKLWHVHNEYGVPVFDCYCATSAAAFRTWLRARYGTVAALNRAWGTVFWGQRYSDWAEIEPPVRAATAANPTHQLDYQRFSNDELLDCYRAERDAIRAHSSRPVTTNLMTTNRQTPDYWAWAPEMDLIANDHYLTAEREDAHVDLALSADLTRSYAQGRPWVLMEHSTSAVNWQPRNLAKAPGELRRNSLQHVARGADATLFFQFRAHPFGAEKFHSAMVPQAGPDTRVFREVSELGADLALLRGVLGSRVRAEVAILWDPPSFWAQDLEWRPSVDLDHRAQIEAHYRALWDRNVTVAFAHPAASLDGYRLVIAPASYLLSAAAASNLSRYVSEGGNLLVSYFSGIVNECEHMPDGPMPGQLREVLGLTVEEFLPLRAGQLVRLGGGGLGSRWAEHVELGAATCLDTFADGPASGRPAVAVHAFGSGRAWYLATSPDAATLAGLLASVLATSGVSADVEAGEGLEHVVRRGDGQDFHFWINHSGVDREVGAVGRELLSGTPVAGSITVPAGDVRIVSTVAAG